MKLRLAILQYITHTLFFASNLKSQSHIKSHHYTTIKTQSGIKSHDFYLKDIEDHQ